MNGNYRFKKTYFFVGLLNNESIATAMFGYDGHRGWLHYFAVLPKFQKQGFGRQLLAFGEAKLIESGCPKLNLQVRHGRAEAINFYTGMGYSEDDVISLGKRLLSD